MTQEATLDEFTTSGGSDDREPNCSLTERLLDPISPELGLHLIPGQGDSLYLQNRGTERYLFRDEHGRWFILQPSAKRSQKGYVRWVFLPDDKPERFARTALQRRTVIGYDYVYRESAPDSVDTTVTAMFVVDRGPDTIQECTSCGEVFETALDHAVHAWDAHPWVPRPEQVRRERRDDH